MATTKTTACAQVFAVTELLELILLRLPPRDLLLSQRTCSVFQACVAQCPSLQRHLYFRTQNQVAEDYDGNHDDFNPMLLENDEVWPTLEYFRLVAEVDGISNILFKLPDRYHESSAFTVMPFETDGVLRTVETGNASYLDMFLQQSLVHTEIRAIKGSMNEQRGRVNWIVASMVVKASTVRELLELTVAMKRAAGQLEDIEDEKKQWELHADERRVAGEVRHMRAFGWRDSFTRAQLARVLSEPEITLDNS